MSNALALILPLAWRNLWRNKRRSVLTMLAIAVAVSSMVILGAFMRAWSTASLEESINNLTGHIQIHHPSYLDDPDVAHLMNGLESNFTATLKNDGVLYAKRIRVPAMVRTERENAPVELIGIEPNREKKLSFIADAIKQGKYFSERDSDGIIIGQKLATRIQTQLGHRLVLLTQDKTGQIAEKGVKIVGIYQSQPAIEKSVIFLSIKSAQKLIKVGDDFSELVILLPQLSQVDSFKKKISGLTQWQVKSWDELQPFTKAMMEMSNGTIYIWIIVSFTIVSFGLINTLLMAVFERTRELGLLQALGMQPGWMILQVLLESLTMILLATMAGIIGGALLVLHFENGLHLGIGASYFGAAQVVYPKLNIAELLSIGMTVFFLGLLASLYPAWKASRQVPVEILARATN